MYKEYAPPRSLAKYIEAIWIYDPALPPGPACGSVVRNRGVAELAIQLGDRFKHYNGSGFDWIPRHCLLGFMTRPCPIGPSGVVKTVGIRFRPGGLRLYSRASCRELSDRIVDARDVLDGRLLSGLAPMHHAVCDEAIIRCVREALIRGTSEDPPPLYPVDAFIGHCRAGNGGKIAGFCRRNGVSSRRLERWFNELVGISPAGYMRVQRFRRVLDQAASRRSLRWTDLAADYDYSDQAHLSRDFKAFSGFSPREFHGRRYHFSLVKEHEMSFERPLVSYVAGSVLLF